MGSDAPEEVPPSSGVFKVLINWLLFLPAEEEQRDHLVFPSRFLQKEQLPRRVMLSDRTRDLHQYAERWLVLSALFQFFFSSALLPDVQWNILP